MSEQSAGEGEHDEWDEQWLRVSEMKAGSEDPFPAFADEVLAAMERAANEVGRPLVMKVTVQVHDGELNRPGDTDGDGEADQ